VFYRTQRLADEGRAWFEALAGDSVRHLSREHTDPVEALREGLDAGESAEALPDAADVVPDLTPEQQSAVLDQVVRRIYADWADKPLPVLGDRTPREAIRTRAGLARVKGLLRSYADSEDERAAREGRRPVSFVFLWEALGVEPE